jgi:hypothetical protein
METGTLSAVRDIPRFADLPIDPSAPPHSSWGVWGEGDRLANAIAVR